MSEWVLNTTEIGILIDLVRTLDPATMPNDEYRSLVYKCRAMRDGDYFTLRRH